ncbi:MAG TPA: hypothetical protein VHP83_26510 [Aggregatilineaceae bacterium]|nr:hypothetical protein [Aggregatilineaceae bacterium]
MSLEASEMLLTLIFFAMDHGIQSVSGGGPLTPFVMSQTDEKPDLHRFAAETLEEGVSRALEFVATLPPTVKAYAVAFDGYITIDHEQFDAVIVEAGERGKEFSFTFAQRYMPTDFQTIGNPVYLGQTAQRLQE